MRAVVMHEPGNITVEETPKPTILKSYREQCDR